MTNDLKNQQHGPTDQADPAGGHEARAWLRWLRNASIVGLSISLLVHVVMLAIAANILFARTDASLGPGGTPEPVEFAVITEAELRELNEAADAAEAVIPEATLEPAESPEDFTLDPIDLAELTAPTSQMSDQAPSDLGGGDLSRAGLVGIEGTGSGEAGGEGFFGIEATGKRFAFILDKSGSMRGGKLDILKNELLSVLDTYQAEASVFITFYSSGAPVHLGKRVRWRDCTPEVLFEIKRELAGIEHLGGTDPTGALEDVERLRPRPDAIYLLTDGKFDNPALTVAECQRISRRFACPIHCVLLAGVYDMELPSTIDATTVMQRIAETTGGSFSLVETP